MLIYLQMYNKYISEPQFEFYKRNMIEMPVSNPPAFTLSTTKKPRTTTRYEITTTMVRIFYVLFT